MWATFVKDQNHSNLITGLQQAYTIPYPTGNQTTGHVYMYVGMFVCVCVCAGICVSCIDQS